MNERYDMEYTGTSKKAVDELLCVSADNAEIKGEYFSDPGSYEADATVFDDAKGQKAYAYPGAIPGSTRDSGTAMVRCRLALQDVWVAACGWWIGVPQAVRPPP